MRDEKAWAEVREQRLENKRLREENARLRKASHSTGQSLWHRNKELERLIAEHRDSPWSFLPWRGYIS